MKTPFELEADARDRCKRLAKTFGEARARMTPAALAGEALGLIDPRFDRLRRVSAILRRHPLIAASVFAVLGYFVRYALDGVQRAKPALARAGKRIRNPQP